MTVALYAGSAGSFDPIHLGHLGVIEHAARTYESVVVAVVANPEKSAGMFRPEERLRLATEATAHLPTVRSVHFYGLTVALARREGATVLVRSAHKERGNEFAMAAMNRALAEIPTVFVPADAPRNRPENGRLPTSSSASPPHGAGPSSTQSHWISSPGG